MITQNSTDRRIFRDNDEIHLLEKDFLLMARVTSDSNVHCIDHIFRASGMRLTSLSQMLPVSLKSFQRGKHDIRSLLVV